ncbi:MAG: phosphoenolpyruvate carboxykinase (ATP) [Phycisphaerales bacterium]|nr:phosphoenolpyruvate carboxykinase (ATP) [Phycisphaerales bacterium]
MGLEQHGLVGTGDVFWNLSADELIDRAVADGDGRLTETGALAVTTGKCTGRRPRDRFIVETPDTNDVDWGAVNIPLAEEHFRRLHQKVLAYFKGRPVFARDGYAGADPASRLKVRVINERAWHNLFSACMFIQPDAHDLQGFRPDFTILNAPWCPADPKTDGTPSEVFVVINFKERLVLIGGTQYAGEIKKSVFSIMNYLLPKRGVFSMHCSGNVGAAGDVALFFGLSGTGKTTLSADPQRRLIGDDEHGWSDRGVFNIEGGCYAKCIKLSREFEPQIYQAIRRGAVVENVVMDEAGRVDFESAAITENTRAAYPLSFIDNALIPSVADHPKNVVFLTCDAFGVLPPMSRLTPEQAMYHFMSGYTAKVAGTEAGVTEPQATFSTCFGAPFMPLPATTYAKMLGEKLAKHRATCWLINTGWSGGGYGVGKRMNIHHTRSMVTAALSGALTDGSFEREPFFGLQIPNVCLNVPPTVLHPRETWSDGGRYDAKARELAGLFRKNFEKFPNAGPAIRNAGPVA